MCIVTRQISEQAKFRPNAAALRYGDIELSYGELYGRANQLAEYLRKQASVSGGTVAICLERSVDWVIAALAIMQAGGAYVPLDLAWPEARIRYAAEESGAVALVARASTLERLELALPGVDPYRDASAIAKTSGVTDCETSPEALAYVIYTSGSTGVPKGVEITHANLAQLVEWHREAFSVSPQDRASHLAGLGFDASAWEIWPSLCAGATLCIPSEAVLSSPDLVRSWMLQEGITIGFVPSVYAASMMEMEWPASTALRFFLTGGDVLHRGPNRRLPFAVVNNYGPTECTVVATSTILQAGESGTPAIGRPIEGTTIYILDENREEVPIGSPGEIYIGGDKVGRGYRNMPELTKEFFVADPFSKIPGARLYRSGDRGALRPDGQIQFLGRADRQVKIRGKRLELDEVGSVLSRHPSVSISTVVALNHPAKEGKQLVAYVVLKPDCEVSQNELVTHFARHFPDYMIPTAIVQLKQMPLSASGKLDFASLPAPSDENLLESVPKEKPANATEQHLLDIILDLLDGKPIGVNENVFLAGGDSLLGMQLIIALKEKFSVELRFDQIFEAGTIRGLAGFIEEIRGGEQGKPIQDNAPGATRIKLLAENAKGYISGEGREAAQRFEQPSLPTGVIPSHKATSSKAIFWVHYLNVNLDKALGQDRHTIFLTLTPEDVGALDQTPVLTSVAALFVQKIVMTQPQGPYTIGGYCLGAILSYEIAVQLRKEGHVVDLLMMLDPPTPSYMKTPNSMRAKLSSPRYLAMRIKKAGLRGTLRKLRARAAEYLTGVTAEELEKSPIQKLFEAAASTYRGETYDGRVLLMLAAERAPHVNFLPEWQALIHQDMHCEYIGCHHDDLMKEPNVQRIAEVIRTNLDHVSRALPGPSNSDIKLVLSSEHNRSGAGAQKEDTSARNYA